MFSPRYVSPRCIFVAGLLLLHSSAFAQQAAPIANAPAESSSKLTLDQILLQLDSNYLQYRSSIPSFFCDELVVSKMQEGGKLRSFSRADSIFRLKRSGDDKKIELTESREIKAINGTPVKGEQTLNGPATFSGAFSAASGIVTFSEKGCFTYQLAAQPVAGRYIIRYATKAPNDRDEHCFNMEPSTGRAFINPQTMQIERIECRTPNHPIPGTHTLWTWSIDYGKVALNGKTFWLPQRVMANSIDNNSSVEWSFDAAYSNYHELTVTSRILSPDK